LLQSFTLGCYILADKSFEPSWIDRPLSPDSEYVYSTARQAMIDLRHRELPMNHNSSGTSEVLFIYRVQSATFMQNTGFLLQNFTLARQTFADTSFEVS